MNNNPSFIIIPAFEKYLQHNRAILPMIFSIDYEVIVVVDGSPDNTAKGKSIAQEGKGV